MISLSVSRIKTAKQCMQMFSKIHVERKWKQVWSQAADAGTAAHTVLERYIKGEVDQLPGDTHVYIRRLAEQSKLKPVVYVEHDIVFTPTMSLTHPKDWDNAWFRIKMDLITMNAERSIAQITDWKNGQRRVDEYQLDVYAWGAFNAFPTLRVLAAQYAWLQNGKADRATYKRDMLPQLDQRIREDEAKILSDIKRGDCWTRKGFWCTNCPGKITRQCKEWQ